MTETQFTSVLCEDPFFLSYWLTQETGTGSKIHISFHLFHSLFICLTGRNGPTRLARRPSTTLLIRGIFLRPSPLITLLTSVGELERPIA